MEHAFHQVRPSIGPYPPLPAYSTTPIQNLGNCTRTCDNYAKYDRPLASKRLSSNLATKNKKRRSDAATTTSTSTTSSSTAQQFRDLKKKKKKKQTKPDEDDAKRRTRTREEIPKPVVACCPLRLGFSFLKKKRCLREFSSIFVCPPKCRSPPDGVQRPASIKNKKLRESVCVYLNFCRFGVCVGGGGVTELYRVSTVDFILFVFFSIAYQDGLDRSNQNRD